MKPDTRRIWTRNSCKIPGAAIVLTWENLTTVGTGTRKSLAAQIIWYYPDTTDAKTTELLKIMCTQMNPKPLISIVFSNNHKWRACSLHNEQLQQEKFLAFITICIVLFQHQKFFPFYLMNKIAGGSVHCSVFKHLETYIYIVSLGVQKAPASKIFIYRVHAI